MVSGHACIRVQKMALPLIARGHKVHLIAKKIPSFYEEYASFTMTPAIDNYIEAIKMMAKSVDIFHVHNEPSWFVTAIKEYTDVPVVLDVHDADLARMTDDQEAEFKKQDITAFRRNVEERNNFQLADALVYPSESFGRQVQAFYNLNQPQLVLPSYVPKSLYRYNMGEYLGGLVYEGRVDLKEEVEKDPQNAYSYCEYSDLAQKAHDIGIQFNIYAVRQDEKFINAYKDIAFVHEPKEYEKMLKRITRHDWGLVGNIHPTPEWDVALPNKFFEYLAAGIPIVAINAKTCSDLINESGIGITVGSMEELKERWREHEACRLNVTKFRQLFSMDNNIDQLESFYKHVLDNHSKEVMRYINTHVSKRRTICEVLREINDIAKTIDDEQVKKELQDRILEGFAMGKKMNNKLFEYKHNWDAGVFNVNEDYAEDLNRRNGDKVATHA